MNGRIFMMAVVLMMAVVSCDRMGAGKVCTHFSFSVDGVELSLDSAVYVNAAGNQYQVRDVQFFISDVCFIDSDGDSVRVRGGEGVHYVDMAIPQTLHWHVNDRLPVGDYTRVVFTFGLDNENNRSYRFANAPENNMSWPANLGGGYHYMKINGFWWGNDGEKRPFGLHTGVNVEEDENGGLSRVDNSFRVCLPLNNVRVLRGETADVYLDMNVNRWFSGRRLFDFNVYGGSIMQNEEAQQVLKENGPDVFSSAR